MCAAAGLTLPHLHRDWALALLAMQEEAFLSFDLFDSNLERLIHERS